MDAGSAVRLWRDHDEALYGRQRESSNEVRRDIRERIGE